LKTQANSTFEPMPRRGYIYLVLIFLLAAGLRVYNLDDNGLWMDEIHSAIGASPDKSFAEVIEYCKTDQPPLFFLILNAWYKLFGYNDVVGRLLGSVTGLLGIISMFFLGREFKGWRVGLVAALLTAINYFHVDHSRQVRFYPLVFFFSSLSYLFFFRAIKNKKPVDFLLYAFCTSALLNTHYFGMVVFASQLIIFIVVIFAFRLFNWRLISLAFGSGLLAGLSLLHWLPVILSDLSIESFHLEQVPWYFPVQYYYVYFRDPVTVVLCAGLSAWVTREMIRNFNDQSNRLQLFVMTGWVVLAFLIPLIYSWFRMPMLEYKYSFIAVPAVILFVSMAFDPYGLGGINGRSAVLKYMVLIVLMICFFINSFFFERLYHDRSPRQKWREVVLAVAEAREEKVMVLANYAWYLRYYFKIYQIDYPIMEPRFAGTERLKQFDVLWLISSTTFPDEGASDEQLKVINAEYHIIQTILVDGFQLTEYKRNQILSTTAID